MTPSLMTTEQFEAYEKQMNDQPALIALDKEDGSLEQTNTDIEDKITDLRENIAMYERTQGSEEAIDNFKKEIKELEAVRDKIKK